MIYRYRKLDNNDKIALEAFLEDKLFFSTPANFNDPFDCLMYYDKKSLFEKGIRDIRNNMLEYMSQNIDNPIIQDPLVQLHIFNALSSDEKMREFIKSIESEFETIKKEMKENLKIICFSNNRKSELMWAHYANNHMGFELGYKVTDLINAKCYLQDDKITNRKLEIIPVEYQNERKDIGTYIFNRISNRVTYESGTKLPVNVVADISDLYKALCRKSMPWSYEEEYRMIPRTLDPLKKNKISYIKVTPKDVILGNRIANEDRETIIKKCIADGINVYDMVIDENKEYQIQYKRIN